MIRNMNFVSHARKAFSVGKECDVDFGKCGVVKIYIIADFAISTLNLHLLSNKIFRLVKKSQ